MIPSYAQVLLADNSFQSQLTDDPNYSKKLSQLLQKCQTFYAENEDYSYNEPDILHEFSSLPLEVCLIFLKL